MNSNDTPHDVADLNIERLLSKAYSPESVNPDFVRRLEQRLLATASTAAHARTPLDSGADSARLRSRLAGSERDPQRLGRVRLRLGLVMGVAAAAAIVALVFHGLQLSRRGSVE